MEWRFEPVEVSVLRSSSFSSVSEWCYENTSLSQKEKTVNASRLTTVQITASAIVHCPSVDNEPSGTDFLTQSRYFKPLVGIILAIQERADPARILGVSSCPTFRDSRKVDEVHFSLQ